MSDVGKLKAKSLSVYGGLKVESSINIQTTNDVPRSGTNDFMTPPIGGEGHALPADGAILRLALLAQDKRANPSTSLRTSGLTETPANRMMILLNLFFVILGLLMVYTIVTLVLMVVVHQLPRRPVMDPPDWGNVQDTRIRAVDGRSLEVWSIDPEIHSRGIVVLAHVWGRNRDRMIKRARMFGDWGFTTVVHSARDHGRSSRKWFMSAPAFADDIVSVMEWIGEPVILYGHSMGAAGAIIAAWRSPERVRLLFLEGCYARTKEALLSLYRWFNRYFGVCLAPAVLVWMDIVHRADIDRVSPVLLAPDIHTPVMLIHGERDRRFPLSFAEELRRCFPNGPVPMYIAPSAGHSDSSLTPGYAYAVRAFMELNYKFPKSLPKIENV